jgi:hypothetical protein
MTPGEIPQSEATERVEQLVALTERLTSLIAEQAKAFEGRRPQDAAVQLEEIGRLANTYRHESARVRANPALVASASPMLRKRLYRATEAFDAVLARQNRAVAAAKFVTEGLVRAIAEEVASQRQQGSTYGANAVTGLQDATAITLNKRA